MSDETRFCINFTENFPICQLGGLGTQEVYTYFGCRIVFINPSDSYHEYRH